jgi:hypothetical protein
MQPISAPKLLESIKEVFRSGFLFGDKIGFTGE